MKQITMDMDSLDPMNNSDEDVFVEEEEGPHVYTVSELNGGIRDLLEGEFPLLWIQGRSLTSRLTRPRDTIILASKTKRPR